MSNQRHSNDGWGTAGRELGISIVITTILFIIVSVVTLRFVRQIPAALRSYSFSSRHETLRTVAFLLLLAGFGLLIFSVYLGDQLSETRYTNIINFDGEVVDIREYRYTPPSVAMVSVGGMLLIALSVVGGVLNETTARMVKPKAQLPDTPIQIFIIRTPHDIKYRYESITQFVQGFINAFPYILLQIHGDCEGVTWRVVDTASIYSKEMLQRHVRNTYPDAEVDVIAYEPKHYGEHRVRYVSQYTLGNPFVMPMQHLEDFRQHDPLSVIVEALSDMQQGEQLIYAIGLFGQAFDAYDEGLSMITNSTVNPLHALFPNGLQRLAGQIITNDTRTEKYQARDQRVLENKLREQLYRGIVMVQADADSPHRVQELIGLVEMHLGQFAKMPYNGLAWVRRDLSRHLVAVADAAIDFESDVIGWHNAWREPFVVKRTPAISVFSGQEIAALWHLPTDKIAGTNVQYADSSTVKMPGKMARDAASLATDDPTTVYVGTGKYQQRDALITLQLEDRRLHTNIIGKTGMGKSNLMHHLIHQDIAHGRGVAVIDPHGTLVQAVLQTSIPESRVDDVIILDLQNQNYPPPINPMRGAKSYVEVGRVVSVLEKLFSGTDQQVRLARYIRAGVALLQEDQTPTMRDISRLFSDNEYRHALLDKTNNPFAQDVWEHFETLSAAQKAQIHDPILSRLSHFYGNPALYPILCHPQALPIKNWMLQKKIILISLAMSEDTAAEQERNLIGSLVVSLLQMSAMDDKSEPFFAYIDEVQKFVTTSLDIVLSEARKFGLALTVANQFLGQLEGKTLEAVMGNVGTTIAFRCSPQDAKALGPFMHPQFQTEDLVGIDRFKAAIKMQVNGVTQPAFTLHAPVPIEQDRHAAARERAIRQRSIELYTPMSRADILHWLAERYPRRSAASNQGNGSQSNNEQGQPPTDKPSGKVDDSGLYDE